MRKAQPNSWNGLLKKGLPRAKIEHISDADLEVFRKHLERIQSISGRILNDLQVVDSRNPSGAKTEKVRVEKGIYSA